MWRCWCSSSKQQLSLRCCSPLAPLNNAGIFRSSKSFIQQVPRLRLGCKYCSYERSYEHGGLAITGAQCTPVYPSPGQAFSQPRTARACHSFRSHPHAPARLRPVSFLIYQASAHSSYTGRSRVVSGPDPSLVLNQTKTAAFLPSGFLGSWSIRPCSRPPTESLALRAGFASLVERRAAAALARSAKTARFIAWHAWSAGRAPHAPSRRKRTRNPTIPSTPQSHLLDRMPYEHIGAPTPSGLIHAMSASLATHHTLVTAQESLPLP